MASNGKSSASSVVGWSDNSGTSSESQQQEQSYPTYPSTPSHPPPQGSSPELSPPLPQALRRPPTPRLANDDGNAPSYTRRPRAASSIRRSRFAAQCNSPGLIIPPTHRTNALQITSPFETPPENVGNWDWETKDSYFEAPPGFGGDPSELEEIHDISTPLPATVASNHRTRQKTISEEELKAALEGKADPAETKRLSSHERSGMLKKLGSFSAPVSANTSPIASPMHSPVIGSGNGSGSPIETPFNVPVSDLDLEKGLGHGEIIESSHDPERELTSEATRQHTTDTTEAHNLVRAHTQKKVTRALWKKKGDKKGDKTHTRDKDVRVSIEPCESQRDSSDGLMRGGVLSSLLKLYNNGPMESSSMEPPSQRSGRATPKWYTKSANSSTTSLATGLLGSSQTLIAPVTGSKTPKYKLPRPRPTSAISGIFKQNTQKGGNIADEIRITIHIAELLSRQKYVLKLCRALMLYGAPTHRLEEYMRMTCRVLEIDGQFLYIPGCMVISFDDPSTHTSDMRIVRVTQGCDLGKLHDTHIIYKEVVHDIISVDEANQRLEEVMTRKLKHPAWLLVGVYGLASALVGPFAFGARPIDMPMSFLLGCILGYLQLIVAPKSDLYSNVFEISASVILSFLARALGSINNGQLFCFSALAQSSIALILPGYIILCGSLEMQSKNIVAGSVRMFYAIIYSLFLGFGITVGAALYGAIDQNATSATSCANQLERPWAFLFVPLFALCLSVINQAKWQQIPLMVAIAVVGYAVNYFSVDRFPTNPQVVSGLGALAIGLMGNLYSRVGHGLAFAAMLPAVFVQVPSGLAAQGSIVSGIENADAISRNSSAQHSQDSVNSTVLNLGFGMIQISIGLTVGLFATALLLYPFGKKRSGLFTF
ncbi:hypothetical protein DFH27DRAFT_526226 [Peziza echinospora]|nr:hypothetical protein DFH27DRAFT_526226 [Peziza echinospora]